MTIQHTNDTPLQVAADLLVVFSHTELTSSAQKIDTALSHALQNAVQHDTRDAHLGQTWSVPTAGQISAKRVLLVSTGSTPCSGEQIYTIGTTIGAYIKEFVLSHTAIVLTDMDTWSTSSLEETVRILIEGCMDATYTFGKYKGTTTKKATKSQHLDILVGKTQNDSTQAAIASADIRSKAVSFTRDLVNEPPSVTTPSHVADVARSLVSKVSQSTCTVYNKSQIQKLGMGGLLGVAQGSDEEPRFVHLSYNGGGKKKVTIVGKGITFDTGGLSLKSASNMETMKLDMGGAAAVLGVFHALPQLGLPIHVDGLLPIAENMPSGKAMKPGDIVRTMSGKTIEVLNTDAEGRIVLADALSYAMEKIKPDYIIDLATLTGACMIALGDDIAGLFSSDETLATDLLNAAQTSGEKIWRLPLVKEYKDQLKSHVADIKNIGNSRYGGAILGALFLQEFVESGQAWAHLDIAGPAFAEKATASKTCGATGFGVRLLLSYLEALSKE